MGHGEEVTNNGRCAAAGEPVQRTASPMPNAPNGGTVVTELVEVLSLSTHEGMEFLAAFYKNFIICTLNDIVPQFKTEKIHDF